MNRDIDYSCMVCHQVKPKDELLTKRAVFMKLGRGGKAVRSTTIGWICLTCVENDPDYTRKKYDAPGLKGTRIAEQTE